MFITVETSTKINPEHSDKFDIKIKKLAVVVHVLQTTQNLVISSRGVVLKRTTQKCTNNYNARAEPLFCSLMLLFSDVLVAVAVVVS